MIPNNYRQAAWWCRGLGWCFIFVAVGQVIVVFSFRAFVNNIDQSVGTSDYVPVHVFNGLLLIFAKMLFAVVPVLGGLCGIAALSLLHIARSLNKLEPRATSGGEKPPDKR